MALQDDYLPCSEYIGHKKLEENPKITFFASKDSEKYYFALLINNDAVLLKSEGYTSEKARANGLKTVLTNIDFEKQISVKVEGSMYFLSLKAKNNKEIARSCNFGNEPAALKAMSQLLKFNGIETESKIEKEVAQTEIKSEKVSEYLPWDEYLNQERVWDTYGITGFSKFQHTNTKFYYAVYNPDGSLYLASKAYDTENDRDDAFDLMESSILLEENYKVENIEGKYSAILFEDEEVLASSPSFETFIAAFVTTPAGRPQENSGTIY